MVLRGKESDILLSDTMDQMKSRGPGIKSWSFAINFTD
jgi:hypothetical protein